MRRIMRGAVLAGLVLAALAGQGAGQGTRANAEVRYMDRAAKKEVKVKCRIVEENPGGIKISVREGKKEVVKQIAPDVIVHVLYPSENAILYNKGFNKERIAAAAKTAKDRVRLQGEAVAEYLRTEEGLKGRPEARRYLQYRAAMAGVKLGTLDPSRAAEGLKRLKEFAAEHRGGWEILPALKTLARLQEDSDKPGEARQTYEQIAGLSDIPKELARQSALLVSKLYLREGKPAEAQKRLEAVASKLSPGDSDKPYVEAYLAECRIAQGQLAGVEKSLAGLAKEASDPRLLGVLHNVMGEAALKASKPEDAFWHFLRVDALYNEDPEEQARALYRLAPLFDKVKKDPVRGKECLRRLAGKALEATRYAKQAKAEKRTGE